MRFERPAGGGVIEVDRRDKKNEADQNGFACDEDSSRSPTRLDDPTRPAFGVPPTAQREDSSEQRETIRSTPKSIDPDSSPNESSVASGSLEIRRFDCQRRLAGHFAHSIERIRAENSVSVG